MAVMKEESVSSEEKLLRLIRKKKQKPAAEDPLPQEEIVIEKDIKKQTDPAAGSQFLIQINRAILVALIVLAGYGIFKYFKMGAQAGRLQQETADLSDSPGTVVAVKWPQPKPFSYYGDVLSSRDFFQAPWEKPVLEQGTVAVTVDLQNEIKLVGILLDQEPKAVVENLKTQETLFLSRGEAVGNAVLEEIKPDRVIFSYNGNRVEMIL